MKRFVRLSIGVIAIALLSISISSYAPASNANPEGNNGLEVIVQKDSPVAYLVSECNGHEEFYAESSTTQYIDGLPHMATVIFQIPKDHCILPEKAVRVDLSEWAWFIINPGGKVVFKVVFN